MRRLVVLFLPLMIVFASFAASQALAVSPTEPADPAAPATTIDSSFLDTERDLTECLNNSIELPGCGRAPEQAGDRGGALQLVTFGLLGLGIAFISWRVVRGVRARDAALTGKLP